VSESLVSVVIPLFNKEKYILCTLKSVIAQDYKNVELILIDDGSTDKGYEVSCKLLEDSQSRFRRVVTISTVNQGQTAARNEGIKQSKGEFLAFLDADDVWVKSKLSRQVEFLKANPQFDMVLCNYLMVHESRVNIKAVSLKPAHRKIVLWLLTTGFGGLIESTGMVRKSALMNGGVLNSKLEMSGGLDLAFRFNSLGKVGCVDDYLCGYSVSYDGWHNNKEDMLNSTAHLLASGGIYAPYKKELQINLQIYMGLWTFRNKPSLNSIFQFLLITLKRPVFVFKYLILTIWRLFMAQARAIIQKKRVSEIIELLAK
jgi:glycosyltransferase involved in cell wall biosynthesis